MTSFSPGKSNYDGGGEYNSYNFLIHQFQKLFFFINVTIQDESQTSCVQILTLPLGSCEN